MTLTAKHEVVNAAMAHLGEPGFESITTDPPGATLAKVLAQLEGRAGVEMHALSRHPWLCALRYATLSPLANPPVNWKWANLFLLPDTFVKVWELAGEGVPYEVGTETINGAEKKVIRCDEASVRVAFTLQLPFEAYCPDLCHYMALKLAARTAGSLKSDWELAARLRRDAAEALGEATGGEAGQHAPQETMFGGGFADLRAQGG